MTPDRALATLDRTLALHGEDITLNRVSGPTDPIQPFSATITIRGFVRPSKFTVGDIGVIVSPTDIIAADWAVNAPIQAGDPNLPRKTDKLNIEGRLRNINAVRPFYIQGVLVRIEMDASG